MKLAGQYRPTMARSPGHVRIRRVGTDRPKIGAKNFIYTRWPTNIIQMFINIIKIIENRKPRKPVQTYLKILPS
jgi:hypothetical protein